MPAEPDLPRGKSCEPLDSLKDRGKGDGMQVPAPVEYERATTIDEAIALLERYGDEARLFAGASGIGTPTVGSSPATVSASGVRRAARPRSRRG